MAATHAAEGTRGLRAHVVDDEVHGGGIAQDHARICQRPRARLACPATPGCTVGGLLWAPSQGCLGDALSLAAWPSGARHSPAINAQQCNEAPHPMQEIAGAFWSFRVEIGIGVQVWGKEGR